MRTRALTPLALAFGALFTSHAHASGDGNCYPDWTITHTSRDACSNLPFLSPGNDSRVNLRLLMADAKVLEFTPSDLTEDDVALGYGPVPFDMARLEGATLEEEQATDISTVTLNGLLETLGIAREQMETAGDAFLEGEGSRCRSNSDDSAAAFVQQVVDTPQLASAERKALANARVQMLGACEWAPQQQAALLAQALKTPEGQAFGTYLQAAADFYSGRFSQAQAGFQALADSPLPWLKETARYLAARVSLNAAQQSAFDEYGGLKPDLDRAPYGAVAQRFQDYLKAYPDGQYAASATGLLRRAHWLAGDTDALAADYAWQLLTARSEQRSVPVNRLVQEIDSKLFAAAPPGQAAPMLTAVRDLMRMRPDESTTLTREQLMAQQAAFAAEPGLYLYLQAAFAFYLDKAPEHVLKLLPEAPAARLDYLAFSQQTLRGLALEAQQDWPAAEALWLKLLPLAQQPLQHEQLELALAMNYERSGRVAKVFAADSPINSAQVRLILLDKVADAPLLRQVAGRGLDAKEMATAQFVLLYKDLMRGQYAAFAEDLKVLSPTPGEDNLSGALGYVYSNGQGMQMFQWRGDKAESGYTCPSIGETAAALEASANDPRGLNCLGEFVLRNGLDGMPLDQRPSAEQLGGTEPAFKGKVFSRLDGYRQVIANAKAERDDKAYALYRAINCYGPSGYDGCGGEEVAPAVRKGWFKQLKTIYANTQWGKSQQYYW